MIFQERDGEILRTIFENDGVLAKRHLKEIFWKEKSYRRAEQRLSKLFRAGYISWPSREQYRTMPIPEPICWLAWKGILYIAGLFGANVSIPQKDNENQFRKLERDLRKQGIHWVREPRWSILAHDIAITDFKLAVGRDIAISPSLRLETWLPESTFRAEPDRISYQWKTESGVIKKGEKGICPDAYFEIVDKNLEEKGKPAKARFLLELDMATHDNPSFGREKAVPGVEYIKSLVYRTRFGSNNGHWLVVTRGGDRRLRNLQSFTKRLVGQEAKLFFFTSFSDLKDVNVLTTPIWREADSKNLVPLFR